MTGPKIKSKVKESTVKKIRKALRYKLDEKELARLKGMQNGFVFDIRSQIEWIDSQKGTEFDSIHYSPLVNQNTKYLRRGTNLYDAFWDEQDRRCIEGYAPIVDGVQYPRITGPHYFYLNMFQIMMKKVDERRKKLSNPYYRALDHQIFLELEKAEKDGYGIIAGKARRMGLSYIGSVMILWNMLFFKDNTVAVGAGKEDKAKLLFDKVVKSLENIREEYRVKYHKKTSNPIEMTLGYTIKEHGVTKLGGIGSKLDVKTFFSDVSAFEGGSYSFFIFEEIGIHHNLIESYKATEPAFTDGADQFGVPFLFGTGGEVDKGSRDFKIMFGSPSSYNLKKLFLPKYMYYPGMDKDESDDKALSDLDELDSKVNFFDVRTGLTDEDAALKHILKRRLMARKSKEGYIKECQSNPIKESDIFLKTSGGLLNRIALSGQREKIYNDEQTHKFIRGDYKWIDTDDLKLSLSRCRNTKEKNLIRIRYGAKVEFVPNEDGKAFKLDGFTPINNERAPWLADLQGTDSYDEEAVVESGSLGASIIYRCFSNLSEEADLPISYLLERGDGTSEDTFFDNNLKMSVYWKCENLIEYTKIALLGYYEDCGAEHHLRVNPTLRAEHVTNNGKQTYGVRMTAGANGFKSLVTKLLKMEVQENVDKIDSEDIIDDLIEYGDENTDLAMAYGVVLIHKLDIFDRIIEDLDDNVISEGDVLMDWAYVSHDANGNVEYKTYAQDSQGEGMKMEEWDPRKHLEGEDRESFINFEAAKSKERARQRKRAEEAYQEQVEYSDPFARQIKEFKENQS